MSRFIHLPKAFLAFFLTIFCILFSFSQDLKSEHDGSSVTKGHALYKKTKIYDNENGQNSNTLMHVGDRAQDRMEYEFMRLKNPFTNEVPKGIQKREAIFARRIPLNRSLTQSTSRNSINNTGDWQVRGPFNVGGRTRALALDIRDENTILAGGVSGGLWRSTDAGQTWTRVTTLEQAPSVTAIVQDTRVGYEDTWYYGSGERSGNSSSGGGAFYTGTGIYKSTDGGGTWNVLEATSDGDDTNTTPESISPFDLVNGMAIDPVNGDLYVATFNGVHRSQDGGDSFEEVLAGGFDSWTEVLITPDRKFYATVDFFGDPNFGYFTSDDGANWTKISPNAALFSGRTVMTYDPSDSNTIYFFAYNLLDGSAPLLFKYNAAEPDETLRFTDLSTNLPTSIGGPVGSLNLQGRYNMIIKVHPANSDLIFLGGTNLYRSETGFTTPAGQGSWIAGYSPLNDVSVYPDQHPDQHNLVFLPSDPNKAVSANDGGLFRTEDITTSLSASEPVDWTSLNNGYFTTQPYTVSFDPDGTDGNLLAGFQDNGSWFTDSENSNATWIEDFGGDGSYNAIADQGATRYVSAQRGVVFRLNFDANGDFESFTRVQPAGASGFGFIAPFILDPVNDNIMYMPAGGTMWRNSDLDGIPLFSNGTTDVNWSELTQTATTDASPITALDVSKYPVANRLYYGTSSGMIFRMDNANINDQPAVDISTGKGLPPGYVSNIAVNPIDPNKVVAVFSNYGIPSVFYSRNGGTSWIDVSGNLEENRDGTGNGPSVRWAAFNGRNEGVFVGTSTGLYYSRVLVGSRTSWSREPFTIGNAVVDQIKTRKDGFAVVAAHGGGMYSSRFEVRARPEASLSVAYLLDDIDVAINSPDVQVDVTDLFVSTSRRPIRVELTNSNPDVVTAVLNGNTLNLSFAADIEGSAAIGLVATQGREKVAEGFAVNIREFPIYDQDEPVAGSTASQFFIDFNGLAQSADDFEVPDGTTWSINRLIAKGVANGGPTFNSVTAVIYENNEGVPGAEVYNSGELSPTNPASTSLELVLPEAVELSSGTYWLSVYVNLTFNPGATQWFWNTQSVINGSENVFKDEADLFGVGATDWTTQADAFGRIPADHIFQLYGSVTAATASQDEESLTTREVERPSRNQTLYTLRDSSYKSIVWPNPSSNSFYFNLQDENVKEMASMSVYNLAGQQVYRQNAVNTQNVLSWDATGLPAGVYIVKIQGEKTNRNFKVVKR